MVPQCQQIAFQKNTFVSLVGGCKAPCILLVCPWPSQCNCHVLLNHTDHIVITDPRKLIWMSKKEERPPEILSGIPLVGSPNTIEWKSSEKGLIIVDINIIIITMSLLTLLN